MRFVPVVGAAWDVAMTLSLVLAFSLDPLRLRSDMVVGESGRRVQSEGDAMDRKQREKSERRAPEG